MAEHLHTAKFVIKVDGGELPPGVASSLESAFVDDSLHLPDLFQLTFRDQARSIIEEGRFRIGSVVAISVFSGKDKSGERLVEGEVTALEAEFDSSGTTTIVRGYDKSHRLFRGRMTETYANVTYSDVASKVARRAGLDIGTVDSSSTVHDLVSQANATDWQFLSGLAGEIGYEVGCLDGKFQFCKPPQSSQGPPKGTLTAASDPLQLVLGANLISVRATVSSTDQVKQIQVRGWDPIQKQELVATAQAATVSTTLDMKPADTTTSFGDAEYVAVSTPFATQSEVEAAAKALAEQIAGAYAELEGVAFGNAKLRAGAVVSMGRLKKPFDGKYTLTTTRHAYDTRSGYTVRFTAGGHQDRSLLALASVNGSGAASPFGAVVTALVTDVNDPDDMGRVKVKFPWLSGSYNSDWARTVQVGAGAKRGAVMLPEVDDEVLVAFDRGDADHPVVLGGLYNGVDLPELGDGLIDGATGAVKRRGFVSKDGHKLVFLDDASKSGILLATAENALRISLNDTKSSIKITSKGKVEVEANEVTVTAKGKLTLKASTGITIDGGPSVEVKGSIIKLN